MINIMLDKIIIELLDGESPEYENAALDKIQPGITVCFDIKMEK